MIAGCYTLDLYCDNYDCMDKDFPHQYINELGNVCRSNARKDGWFIGKEKQLCPKCSGKYNVILAKIKIEIDK